MAATPGDYMVRRNNGETTVLTSSNMDTTWDTAVATKGTSVTYSAGTFTLSQGKYLVMYNEMFDTIDITNNERIEVQGRLVIDSTEEIEGAGQGYIRKSGGSQSCIVQGAAIIDISAETSSLDVRFYRTDDSPDDSPPDWVKRVVDWGGVTIIALDSTWNYARYVTTSNQWPAEISGWRAVSWDSNDEEDTGFSRSGAAITITNAGRYLVAYSAPMRSSGTSDRTEVVSRLALSGTEVEGARVSTYMKESDSTNDGVLSYVGVIDVSASEILRLQHERPDGTSTITNLSGTNIQILQLPAGAETIINEIATADATSWNNSTITEVVWGSSAQIDTDTFTHTEGTSLVEVDQRGDYLFFAALQNIVGGTARAVPVIRFSVNDTLQEYGAAGEYNRGTTGGSTANNAGCSFGTLITGLVPGDDISLEDIETAGSGTMTVDHGAMSGISLSSLFGTADNDSRGAELTGVAAATDVDDSRGAELTGTLDDTDNRGAEVTGTDTANDSRGAELAGITTTDDSRGAELAGSLSSSGNRGAELTGIDTTFDSRGAELTGVDTTSDNRGAELAGSISTNSSRGAEVEGTAPTDADSRGAELTGVDTTSDNRGAEVTGTLDDTSSRGAELTGTDVDTSSRGAELAGITTTFDNRGAELAGLISVNTSRGAEIEGTAPQDNDSRSAELTGVDTTSDNRSAELTGVDTTFDSRGAEVAGVLGAAAGRGAEVTGIDTTSDNRGAEVAGSIDSTASRGAELAGTLDDTDSRSAELTGVDTDTDNRGSELSGTLAASGSRGAEVAGSLSPSGSRAAELAGIDTTSDSRGAETTGRTTASDNRGAELTGKATSSDSRAAELTGGVRPSDSRGAELTGVATTTSSRGSELTGSVTTTDSRGAELTGVATNIATSSRGAEVIAPLLSLNHSAMVRLTLEKKIKAILDGSGISDIHFRVGEE